MSDEQGYDDRGGEVVDVPGLLPRRPLSGFSHAVRNSLNAIGLTLMNAERLLLKEAPFGRRDDIVEQLRLASGEVSVARETILRFVEVVGPLSLEVERFALGEAVDDALDEARAVRVDLVRRATVAVQVPAGLEIEGSRDRLADAVQEVLINALEALSPEGGRVEVRGARDGDEAVVRVVDDGEGLSKKARAEALEPFFTTKAERAGLGLPRARRFAEAHGGGLAIGPRADGKRGAEVVIRLPAAPSEDGASA